MSLTDAPDLRPEHNFRDLGGHETHDGARVRLRAVYRSAHLHQADERERAALAALGIRTVCDLRADEEAHARPSALSSLDGVDVLRFGVIGARVIGDPVSTILEYGFREVTETDIARFYRFIVDRQPRVFGQVLETCADTARHAVVVHCSAGKDRTGIACALVLSALGVPDETVIADYEMTSELWSPAQMARAQPLLEEAGLDFEAVRTYFLAPARAMAQTLEHVRQEYRSTDAYLTGPGGVAPSTLQDLRSALLE